MTARGSTTAPCDQARPWPGVREAAVIPSGLRGGAAERKLRELCDADHRQLHPSTKALAAAVIAGEPLPDPHQQRDQFRAVLDAARTYLAAEPSERCIRSAGHQLSAAITQLTDAMAKKEDD